MNQETLSDVFIMQTLQAYHIPTTPGLCSSIRTYIELLLRWNQKIALTTISDPAEILRLHFGESMLAAHQIPIRHGRLADVGTGAGFPAVPISMVVPELSCVLIESNQKKATFLAEVVRALGLNRVEIFRDRMESFPDSSEKFDFTISRALGIHDKFLSWSYDHLNASGKVIFWVGQADAVQISSNMAWNWEMPSKIPGATHRVLLSGSRTGRGLR